MIVLLALLALANVHAFANDSSSFDPTAVSVQASTDLPIGTVLIWTKNGTLPDGYLECNGQAVSSSYPKLQALMSHTPNYQGMFLRGYGSQSHSQNNGTTVGVTSTTHSSGSLGSVQGDSVREIYGYAQMGFPTAGSKQGVFETGGSSWAGDSGPDIPFGPTTFKVSRVTPTSQEIRPANIAVRYIIKAK